jgi:hypothetical protein
MSYFALQHAGEFLRANGCTRDSERGLWRTADGAFLASDPLESARLLRDSMVRRAVAEARATGRNFTR